jgi:iron-sulfur cluster assembly protein
MFQVTEKAIEMINEFLKDKDEVHSIRVMMVEGGCAGSSLGMALDESKEDDEVFKENGITFMINRDLFELVKPINLDYITTNMGSGFKLTSSLEAGSSCGGSCCCS